MDVLTQRTYDWTMYGRVAQVNWAGADRLAFSSVETVALLDAGLVCTTTLPCPAEMGASIHINGTKSSVVDTIFVCRTTGTVRASQFDVSPECNNRRLYPT